MVSGRIIPNDSGLLIEARSFVTTTVTVKGQILSSRGYKKLLETGELEQSEIKTFATNVTTNSDGSVAIKTPFPRLSAGYLLSMHVFAGNTTLLRRGDCYVNVSLIQGTDSLATNVDIWETLIQGYVYNDYYLSYPKITTEPFTNGKLFYLNIPSPGAGLNLTYTIPSYTRLKIHTVFFRLTTNAAVAVRNVSMGFRDIGGGRYFHQYAFTTQLAALSYYYVWTSNLLNRANTGGLNVVTTEIPTLELAPGEIFNTVIDNLQGGDLIDSINLYVERVYESKLTTSNPGGGGGKGAS